MHFNGGTMNIETLTKIENEISERYNSMTLTQFMTSNSYQVFKDATQSLSMSAIDYEHLINYSIRQWSKTHERLTPLIIKVAKVKREIYDHFKYIMLTDFANIDMSNIEIPEHYLIDLPEDVRDSISEYYKRQVYTKHYEILSKTPYNTIVARLSDLCDSLELEAQERVGPNSIWEEYAQNMRNLIEQLK